MYYTLIRDDESEQVKRLEANDETIWEYDGSGFSPEDDDLIEAILEDANFGQPQKDALKALIGLYDTEFE